MGRKWAYAFLGAFVFVLLVILLVAKSGNENKKIGICRSDGCKASGKRMAKYIERDADVCNDLYQLACGKWVLLDKPKNYSVTDELRENLINQIKTLLGTSLVRSPVPVQLASSFYKNCLDAAPYYAAKWLDEELQDIGGWPLITASTEETSTNKEEVEEGGEPDAADENPSTNWTEAFVKARTDWHGNWIVGVNIIVNPKYKTKYIIKIDLPERSDVWSHLISSDNATSVEKIEEYKNSIRTWVEKMGRKRGQVNNALIDDLVKFETELAKAVADSMVNDKDEEKYMSFGELIETSPDRKVPWETLIKDMFIPVNISLPKTEPLIFTHSTYYKKLGEIISTTPNKVIVTYIGWKFVSQFGADLTSLPVDEVKREEYCLDKTNSHYSHALKRLYVEKYFDSTSRNRVTSIVKGIKQYLTSNLKTLNMAEKDREMRNRIMRKLDKVEALIGYQDWIAKKEQVEDYYSDIPDYSDRKYLGSIVDAVTGKSFKELRKLRQKYTKPIPNPDIPNILSTDAYYDQKNLQMIYAPGYLQTPIYNADAPLPINYGAIGSIIARDLISSIDFKGAEIDENGANRKWWTTKASINYQSNVKCFDDVYDKIVGWGNRSLEDVVRDVEGLRISYETFSDLLEKSRDVRIPKEIKSYSLEQIFFISYAQMFCSNDKSEKVPVNTLVKNFAPFNEAFNCKTKTVKQKKCRL